MSAALSTAAPNRAVQHFLSRLREVSLQHGASLRELASEVFGTLDGMAEMRRLAAGRWSPDVEELGRLHEALDASAMARPFKDRPVGARLTEGMATRRLRIDLATDPVDCLFFHLDLQRHRLRQLEGRAEDFPLATALIVGLAERAVSFENMPVERAVFHEMDRLCARVIELEARERPGHLRVVK